MKVTAASCRRRAAEFYFKPERFNGLVEEWICTGDDYREEVDEDVKDCAGLLWTVAQDAAKYGVTS